MDAARFDNLTRAMGRATSRRKLLALLAGGTAGMAALGIARNVGGAWAEEGASTGAGPIRTQYECSGSNQIFVPCDEIDAYLDQCGMLCPRGQWKPLYGCTDFEYGHTRVDTLVQFEQDPISGRWRAVQWVSVSWSATFLESTQTDPQPPDLCCPGYCHEHLNEWGNRLRNHENEHKLFALSLCNQATLDFGNRRYVGEGRDQQDAHVKLVAEIQQDVFPRIVAGRNGSTRNGRSTSNIRAGYLGARDRSRATSASPSGTPATNVQCRVA